MMQRRRFLTLVSASSLAVGSLGGNSARAEEKLDAETIKAGLHTASREDEGFVQRVVDLMEQGTLPEKLVKSVFAWARRKERNRFQYFKRGLTIQAAKIGVEV
jgi:hypothetical protein